MIGIKDLLMFPHRLRMWLKGLGHGRGFGIQSPWAYQFVYYVINERQPYYAYAQLNKLHPDLDSGTRRLAELYFRIANYRQAERWGFCLEQYDVWADYVKAGCRRSKVIDCTNVYDQESIPQCDVLVMTLNDDWQQVYNQFAMHVGPESILIIEGIHASQSAYKAWKMMLEDKHSGVSFDLYRCGIIFFNKQMYKQHYTLNFR